MQGYAPGRGYKIAQGAYDVFLDGRVISDVVAVDTCAGVAWVCAKDPQGNYVIDRANDCMVIERRTGSFRVEQQHQRAAAA